MNKIKTIILSAALLMFAHVASAQTYDLAVVSYFNDVPKPLILISINEDKFEQIQIERNELQGQLWGASLNPLLKHVNKLQAEGWEVVGGMNTSGLPSRATFYFTLRKKK
jgi:hypothetical protein